MKICKIPGVQFRNPFSFQMQNFFKKKIGSVFYRLFIEWGGNLVRFKMPKAVCPQADAESGTSSKKKPRGVKKRVEGRPHKRLEDSVLNKRMSDLSSKLKVTEARTVLFKDRLDAYVKELEYRNNANGGNGDGDEECDEETQTA